MLPILERHIRYQVLADMSRQFAGIIAENANNDKLKKQARIVINEIQCLIRINEEILKKIRPEIDEWLTTTDGFNDNIKGWYELNS